MDAQAQEKALPRRPGQRDLTSGPIAATLLAFALPTLGSSVLQSLNGSVNAIWVGQFLGENALAATTNGNLVMFLLLAFVFGFGMAATILIGQAFGRRDIVAARRAMGTAVGTFGALVVVMSIVGWFLAPQLLAKTSEGPARWVLHQIQKAVLGAVTEEAVVLVGVIDQPHR